MSGHIRIAAARTDLHALFYVNLKTGIGFSPTCGLLVKSEDLSNTTGLSQIIFLMLVIFRACGDLSA
jgi:uncharacterized protein (UPF0212 family)